jgi:hypothetical protein
LLGARYADFYRRTKMQETIFETLSAQYEIAKVEEAKEIPSVRVLDPANVPEKRSSPNRRLVVTICTFLSFAFGILYVLVGGYWEETDPADPRKTLIIEIGRSVEQSRLYRRVHTLSRPFAAAARALYARFVRRPKS